LKEKRVVCGNGVSAIVVHNVADVHADVATVFKHPVALREDELHVLEVVVEVLLAFRTFIAATHVKIGRSGCNELHGTVRHFGHPARVADYNEVFLFHAHNYRAGVRLWLVEHEVR